MSRLIVLSVIAFCGLFGQDRAGVERAALDYIEGFYEGDTVKIIRSIDPELSKLGFSYKSEQKRYVTYPMDFRSAVQFAKDVIENKDYAAPEDAIKKIEILDLQKKIAAVKLTLYWGIDYLLLVKHDDAWKITKVLWQSHKTEL